MPTYTRHSAHTFADIKSAPFNVSDYSLLKFGVASVAQGFGVELARSLFAAHTDKLLANRIVVIPSPYNFVENAATIMTHHFVNHLNHLLVENSGNQVEYSTIHRKVSYIKDYGFLSKEKRRGLIDNDSFYLNKKFYRGKLLIFVDDVLITGTHEDKLREILDTEKVKNDALFIYYAQYTGANASIEADLNFRSVKCVDDFVNVAQTANHKMIVRPIKFLLSLPKEELLKVITKLTDYQVAQIYNGCLGEGYFKIPEYQPNFKAIKTCTAGI